MPSRAAMLGGALGGGVSQGLNQILQQRAQIENYKRQLGFLKGLSEEDRGLFLQMQGAKAQDPLNAVLAAMLGQQLGAEDESASPAAAVEIRVRRKSDGAVGSIPENEFDPNEYERL